MAAMSLIAQENVGLLGNCTVRPSTDKASRRYSLPPSSLAMGGQGKGGDGSQVWDGSGVVCHVGRVPFASSTSPARYSEPQNRTRPGIMVSAKWPFNSFKASSNDAHGVAAKPA